MIYSINDKIRYNIFNKNPLEFFIYYDMLSDDQKELIFKTVLLDYYKIAFNYNKEYLKIFDKSTSDLFYECEENPDFFFEILNISKLFYDLDTLSKTIIIEDLEQKGQDDNLLSISKTHLLDKISYMFLDDLEYYKEYYKDFLSKNKSDKESRKDIIDFFAFKIISLKFTDEIKYKKFILEFLKMYYKWKIFIKEHEGEHLLNKEDYKYMEIIKNKSIDEIINILESNTEFFISMIEEYMHYSTKKMEIPENIIDEYYELSSDKKLKEKLKTK